jgi:hypothetical protein
LSSPQHGRPWQKKARHFLGTPIIIIGTTIMMIISIIRAITAITMVGVVEK